MNFQIRLKNDKCLRNTNLEVTEFNEDLKVLSEVMALTMKRARGIGIAAPQIGINKQIFIAPLNGQMTPFVNPQITFKDQEIKSQEGCLSVPGCFDTINRFKKICIKFQDLAGETWEIGAFNEEAVIIQHEFDHLQGKLFCDQLSSLKNSLIDKKMIKLKKKVKNYLKAIK